jgi:hypothetical protein
MKRLTLLALLALVGLALSTHTQVVSAAGECRNQSNMQAALDSLRSARASLKNAEHNKGGWRVAAINATETAIKETERGCAAANN